MVLFSQYVFCGRLLFNMVVYLCMNDRLEMVAADDTEGKLY